MEFKQQLNEMKNFLASKKCLKELATRVGVEVRTVHNTFSASSFDDLRGVQLKVYEEAIKMIGEIKSLPAMASEVLKKQL